MRALVLFATLAGLSGCGTEPNERPLEGTYTTVYEPPQLIRATSFCDRLVSRALLEINAVGDFELSINVTDDCSRAEQGFTFFEVLRLGKYIRHGSTLTLTPERESGAAFTGQIEGEFLRLTLPPGVGDLGRDDVELRVGPRSPP